MDRLGWVVVYGGVGTAAHCLISNDSFHFLSTLMGLGALRLVMLLFLGDCSSLFFGHMWFFMRVRCNLQQCDFVAG
jgi:hypothetical protein